MLVIKFKTDQDVIRMANGTDYALGCRYSKFTLTCFLSASNLNISASSQPITRGQRQSPRTSCRACAPSMTCKRLFLFLFLSLSFSFSVSLSLSRSLISTLSPPPQQHYTLSNSPYFHSGISYLIQALVRFFVMLCCVVLCRADSIDLSVAIRRSEDFRVRPLQRSWGSAWILARQIRGHWSLPHTHQRYTFSPSLSPTLTHSHSRSPNTHTLPSTTIHPVPCTWLRTDVGHGSY